MIKSEELINLISQVSFQISHEPDIEIVLDSVLDNIHKVLAAERASILFYNPMEDVLYMKVSRGISDVRINHVVIPMGAGIAGYVAKNKEGVLLKNDEDFRKFGIKHDPLKYRQKSAISVPLIFKEQLLGVINLNDKTDEGVFDEDDLIAMEIIANQAAVAIKNANLFNHYLEKIKLKQSILVAREIQQHFFPKVSPVVGGYQIVSWGKTCDETGGDYYDFYHYFKEQFAIIIGDVAGHGIGAALIMASARAALKAYSEDIPDVEEVYYKLNNLLESNLIYSNFMTLLMVLLNKKDSSFRYISAGHDGPLLFKKKEKKYISYKSNGMVLGVLNNVKYELSDPVDMDPGDFFVLFTDGLYEVRNMNGDFMGKNKIKRFIMERIDYEPKELLEALIQYWQDYKGDSVQEDDISLIIVKKE